MAKDKKKAQDIFNESNFVFSKKGTFEEAFPQIERISIEVVERGYGTEYSAQRTYSTTSEFINCSNGSCYGGGYRMGQVVRNMVYKNETESEGSEYCRGHEGNSKRRGRSCINALDYKVHIEYKIPSENAEDSGEKPE